MALSLTILGSNSALPTSDRYPTAQILRVSERFFLIDCGEGTQMQLRRNKVNFSKINHIFLSHLHGDHVFGLIGLISTFGLLGRRKSLTIHAHEDLKGLLQPHLDYFCTDLPYQIHFNDLRYDEPAIIYEDKKVTVESFPLSHRVSTCGFLFKEKTKEPNIRKEAIEKYQLTVPEIVAIKDGHPFIGADGNVVPEEDLITPAPAPLSYAFCSDTRYFRRIIPVIQGVSLLYHEATFLHELKDLAKRTGHTTAKQAAVIARDADVGQLLLGHFSSRYKDVSLFENEAKEVFLNTTLVSDNTVIEL
ncbi:ribonuclease Z [Carboxylicivirga mesophila]|uniref:Ribonuclease Z n=1 Tax=Carboxylicivirga mesophila TaxID=1166478 RepID=A0ABS5K7C7_9BACT|nr:ribonuclease Z [Carboxylicivirga mesophila]MBS2210866.1 ribonuclease Z [Carboxylicivirga mesophila]